MRALLIVAIVCVGCGRLPIVQPSKALRQATLFTHVRVFDGVADSVQGPTGVLVIDGHIAAIGPGLENANAAHIDGQGGVLMPGLWDGHVHLGGSEGEPAWMLGKKLPDLPSQAAMLLYAGVTTVNLAGHDTDAHETNNDIAARRFAGPGLLGATRILCAVDGHPVRMFKAGVPWPLGALYASLTTRPVKGAAQAGQAAREELAAPGVHHAKAVFHAMPPGVPMLTREELDAIIAAGREAGKPVFVHVGTPAGAVEASEAGAALLMHTPWEADFSPEQIARIKEKGTPLVTTQRIWKALTETMTGSAKLSALEQRMLAPDVLKAMSGPPPEGFDLKEFADEVHHAPDYDRHSGANILALHAAGVTLIAGTDTGIPGVFPGAALHEELKDLVALGLPAADVLKMATSVPARVLDPGGKRGVIEVGAVADLLVLHGDPLADINAIDGIAGVWLHGEPVAATWDLRTP